jgi:signal transduction histidine kinase
MANGVVHILLVEDNPGDARLLREALREALRDAQGLDHELIHVERLEDALQRLKTGAFDVLLLDLSLPDSQGTDTVKRITAAAPHIPVVVLTGTEDESLSTEVVRCGAQDYLVKGQTDHRLLRRAIRYAIERKRVEAALHDLNQTLERRVAERTAVVEQQAQRLRQLASQLLVTEERERRNLAADLHDNLAQILYVAKMKVTELRDNDDSKGRPASFKEIEKLLSRASQTARSLSYQLSPPILYELGLVPALQWLGEEIKRLHGLDVLVESDGHAEPSDERARVILFRAVRELLVNVAKHAGVRKACVRIRRSAERLAVIVEDRGVGFDPKVVIDSKTNHGMGLFNIRERLGYLGGFVEIHSAGGKKTTVTLTVPTISEQTPVAPAQP